MNHESTTDLSVSVIIPACNAETSLGRTIDSALAQELPPHEIIVINDGSTDGTEAVARLYGDRIKVLSQENLGQGAARNAGLAIASGRFVAFLDADDYWLPGFLKKSVEFLLAHEDAIAVSTGIIVRLYGKPERRWPAADAQIDAQSPFRPRVLENFFDFWAKYDHVRTGSNVIRREIIELAGHQRADLRISQDLEYWGYLATWGKWGLIPDHLWVGDPVPAASQGWLNKYRHRRRLCPNVSQWETRILPRLAPADQAGFRKVRGRIAAHFSLSKIKGGRAKEAWIMVREYGDEMPKTWSTRLMRLGLKTGNLGRMAASAVIRGREHYVAMRIGRMAARAAR